MRDWILQNLQGIMKTDFHEYNSNAYAGYTLGAIQNLAEFAKDGDVRVAAKMVLDWSAAKFATSSSWARRTSPFRRRGDHDGPHYSGLIPPACEPNQVNCAGSYNWENSWEGDTYACAFPLYSGQTAMYPHESLPSCSTLVRRAVGKYRIHPLILDLGMRKDIPYTQKFAGGPNYLASTAEGTGEIYDNEGDFMIAAGGMAANYGLGAPVYWGPFFVKTIYAGGENNVGYTVPTVLLPNGPLNEMVESRDNLIRFQGFGKFNDSSLCVSHGFACGVNPTIPDYLCQGNCDDGDWSFVRVPAVLGYTYVAMLGRNQLFGMFEAVPSSTFHDDFDAFKNGVKNLNPGNGNIVTAAMTMTGHYVRVDGSTVDFQTDLTQPFITGSFSRIISENAGDPAPGDFHHWNLADGPIQSDGHSGYIELVSPHFSGKCIIDMRDWQHPRWSCPHFDDLDGDGVLDEDDNCKKVPNRDQRDSNLDNELAWWNQPILGDACDDNPTTAIDFGGRFTNGRTAACKELVCSPPSSCTINDGPADKPCLMDVWSALKMDSYIGNAEGNAATATGTTVPAACPCTDSTDAFCKLPQGNCTVGRDMDFPTPGRDNMNGSNWYSITQYSPAVEKFPASWAPYLPIATKFQEDSDPLEASGAYTPASVVTDWDFTHDLTRMGLPADQTRLAAILWGHVTSFVPRGSEHAMQTGDTNISNSYMTYWARIDQGLGSIRMLPGAVVEWHPWDAVDPLGWASWAQVPDSSDPVLVLQHAGEIMPGIQTVTLDPAASTLLKGVTASAASVLHATDLSNGAAAKTAAPFALVVTRGATQILGALTLTKGGLTGVTAPLKTMKAMAVTASASAEPLLAYSALAGRVFAVDLDSGSAFLDSLDVPGALAGTASPDRKLITGDAPIAPQAITWDGLNQRLLVLDSAGSLCGGGNQMRLLAITPNGEATALWSAVPSIDATLERAFLTVDAQAEIVLSLTGVPAHGRTEVIVFDASGQPVSSGDLEGTSLSGAIVRGGTLSLPTSNAQKDGSFGLLITQVQRSSLTIGDSGAKWLGGTGASAPLPGSGTEQCKAVTASALDPILTLLSQAKESAAAHLTAAPTGDEKALFDAIDRTVQQVNTSADWMRSVNLDGTNASLASNVLVGMNQAIAVALEAAHDAVEIAANASDSDASHAFDLLVQAALRMNELGTQGGRCDLDLYGNPPDSWWDWTQGKAPETSAPPPAAVPATCFGVGPEALDPLTSLLTSVLPYEQAELDANPGEGADEYAQADFDSAKNSLQELATLRESLATSGLTAADRATAESIQSTLLLIANQTLLGGQYATYIAAPLPGPSRNAFEADMTAAHYTIQLAGAVGHCLQTASTPSCPGGKGGQ